jgi:hypothetical protein
MRREVYDRVDGVIVDDLPDQVAIAGFADDEVAMQHRGSEPGTQVVENDDVLSGFPQLSDDVTADVTGAASYEYCVICHTGCSLLQRKSVLKS